MAESAPRRPAARPAGPSDAAEVTRLRDLARAEVAAQRGGEALLAEGVTRPDATVLVGTLGGAVVGLLELDLVAGGPTRVLALYVEPGARRVGVGAALVEAALARASASGSTAVDAEALPGDRATKNFFEGYGFVTRRLTVRRPLTGAE